MKTTWVLVAESSRARIFSTTKTNGPLTEVEILEHPQSRQHEQTLTTDLPGRDYDAAGLGRHAMVNSSEPKQQEAIVFARQIASVLDKNRKNNQYDQLVLMAPPGFLGILRDQLNDNIIKMIVHEQNNNLVQHTAEDIREHLPFTLSAP